MKKNAGILLLGYILLNSLQANAQTYAESALAFSRVNPGGSARIQALGGTQVSLGGDYSSAYSNPAGLGMYNRSEFTFTPGYNSSRTSSGYIGTTTGDAQSKIILPGISFVFHSDKNFGKLLGGTFGISVNRVNDFNHSFSYGGVNKNSSIVDYFVGNANDQNAPPSQLFGKGGTLFNDPTGLAWDNYLVNAAGNQTYAPDTLGHYVNNAVKYFGVPTQHEQVTTKGSQYQINLSYGINLSDKVFLGGGIGISQLDFTSRKTYTETFQGDSILRSLALAESLHISGSGLNLTLGGIYKPIDFFQAGFSIATPTFYVLNETYTAGMATNWNHFPYGAANQPQGTVSTDQVLATYGLNTPWRLSGGLTFFVLKHGFVSGDIEYLGYGTSHYSAQTDGGMTTDDANAYNKNIKNAYRSVFNYRLGAEYRWKAFRLRGGYGFMPNPYKAVQNNVDNNIQSFSGGVGYRTTKFYIDLTGIARQGNTTYSPYTGSPIVTTQNKTTTVMVTVGFPF